MTTNRVFDVADSPHGPEASHEFVDSDQVARYGHAAGFGPEKVFQGP